jgi:hypothetical protein
MLSYARQRTEGSPNARSSTGSEALGIERERQGYTGGRWVFKALTLAECAKR